MTMMITSNAWYVSHESLGPWSRGLKPNMLQCEQVYEDYLHIHTWWPKSIVAALYRASVHFRCQSTYDCLSVVILFKILSTPRPLDRGVATLETHSIQTFPLPCSFCLSLIVRCLCASDLCWLSHMQKSQASDLSVVSLWAVYSNDDDYLVSASVQTSICQTMIASIDT